MHRLDANNRMQLNDGRNFAFYFAEMHLVGSTIVASFSLFFACSLIFYTIFGLGKRCRLSPLRAGILFHVISSSINEKNRKQLATLAYLFFFAQSLSASHHNHIHIRRNNFSFFSSSSLRHSIFYSATSIRAKTKAPRHWMLIENTCRWLIGNRLCEYERIDTHERY